MGRKLRITKEMILQASYELLDESGINAVAIKSIAARLGCSTQPVSWQFGSMTELRKELYYYAADKLYDNLAEETAGKNAIDAFFTSGIRYISNACDHPNVFRFVNVDNPLSTIGESIYGNASIFAQQFDEESAKLFAEEYDLPPQVIGEMIRDVVIYTHGLAVLMIFDNYKLPKEEACKMIYDMGVKLMKSLGIDISPMPQF